MVLPAVVPVVHPEVVDDTEVTDDGLVLDPEPVKVDPEVVVGVVVEPSVDEPVVDSVDDPVVDPVVAVDPVVVEPVVIEPVVDDPVADEPVVDDPVVESVEDAIEVDPDVMVVNPVVLDCPVNSVVVE